MKFASRQMEQSLRDQVMVLEGHKRHRQIEHFWVGFIQGFYKGIGRVGTRKKECFDVWGLGQVTVLGMWGGSNYQKLESKLYREDLMVVGTLLEWQRCMYEDVCRVGCMRRYILWDHSPCIHPVPPLCQFQAEVRVKGTHWWSLCMVWVKIEEDLKISNIFTVFLYAICFPISSVNFTTLNKMKKLKIREENSCTNFLTPRMWSSQHSNISLGLQGISEHFLLNQNIPQEESSVWEKWVVILN